MEDHKLIIDKIINRKEDIFNEIKQESIDVYIFLLEQYNEGNISNNYLFQFIFRSYYRLDNAGLTPEWKEVFFKLLNNKEKGLSKILNTLYKIPTFRELNTIQFSFATKLLNMIDSNSPIYDSQVGDVINQRVTGNSKETKIQSCVQILKNLESLYKMLLGDKKIRDIVSKFRIKYDKQNKCSDAKILDFILWALGKIKQSENKNRNKKL